MDVLLSGEVADRLREIIADFSAVRGAYVFGSVAADQAWERSDLDLGIVVDEGGIRPTSSTHR